jgi:hypothetical protein
MYKAHGGGYDLRHRKAKLITVMAVAILSIFILTGCSNPSGGPGPSSAKNITSFKFSGVPAGIIDREAKTVSAPFDSDADVTNLVPTISVSPGASVSPASGTARDFSGPVTYTVTAEDGSTAVWNVTAVEALTMSTLASYFADALETGTQTDPVPLTLAINLAADWVDLLTALNNEGSYVTLDLSYCTMTGTEFNPGTGTAGVDKIVSLTLPVSAKSLANGTRTDPTFQHFTVLESVTGAGIKTVGEYAFYDCDTLKEVNFPAAQTIGEWAFSNCDALEEVSLPAAQTIDTYAFDQCEALEEVNLPAAQTIRGGAFDSCDALETVNLPASLTTIFGSSFAGCGKLTDINVDSANPFYRSQNGMLLNKAGTTLVAYPSAKDTVTLPGITAVDVMAFAGCDALEEISLPEAQTIGRWAFGHCIALEEVNLPAAQTIGGWAFYGCNALEEVSLPAAQTIREYAFAFTGSASLTVTLGDTVPTLGTVIFHDVTSPKTVTVKVPSGVSGYGSSPANTTDDNWGNAFRGKGWDGTDYLGGTVNGNITLTIQTSP